jgi:hypothetical protein
MPRSSVRAPFETDLSDSREDFLSSPLELNACLNSHGLYDPLRFVLRLSPEVHRKIEALQAEFAAGRVSFEDLRAFSSHASIRASHPSTLTKQFSGMKASLRIRWKMA